MHFRPTDLKSGLEEREHTRRMLFLCCQRVETPIHRVFLDLFLELSLLTSAPSSGWRRNCTLAHQGQCTGAMAAVKTLGGRRLFFPIVFFLSLPAGSFILTNTALNSRKVGQDEYLFCFFFGWNVITTRIRKRRMSLIEVPTRKALNTQMK